MPQPPCVSTKPCRSNPIIMDIVLKATTIDCNATWSSSDLRSTSPGYCHRLHDDVRIWGLMKSPSEYVRRIPERHQSHQQRHPESPPIYSGGFPSSRRRRCSSKGQVGSEARGLCGTAAFVPSHRPQTHGLAQHGTCEMAATGHRPAKDPSRQIRVPDLAPGSYLSGQDLSAPPPCQGGDAREQRDQLAIDIAEQHSTDQHTIWTDGSQAADGGTEASFVFCYDPACRPIRRIVLQRSGRWKEPHPTLQHGFGGATRPYLNRPLEPGWSGAEIICAEYRRPLVRNLWQFG